MAAVEERLVFGDESGTASLRPDPDFPVFVVAMCLVTARDYQQIVEPEFRALKQRHFGHDRVVLHEREIRNGSGVFATLRGAAGRRAFYEDMTNTIRNAPFKIAAVAVDKRQARLPPREAASPYGLCVRLGMRAIREHLRRLEERDPPVRVIFEARGKKEDRELRREMEASSTQADRMITAPQIEIEFESKSAGLVGLELADLIAYPIARHVLTRPQPNLPFEIVLDKMIKGPNGDEDGWGLTIVRG